MSAHTIASLEKKNAPRVAIEKRSNKENTRVVSP